MPLGTDGRPLRSLRRTLLVLVLPPLVLLAAAGALVAWQHWSSQADVAEARLQQGAVTLLRAVDRELMLVQVTAETLSLSPLLDRGDWPAFHALAKQVADRQDGALFALTDTEGRGVLNTLVAADAPRMDLRALGGQQADWHGQVLPVSSLPTVKAALAQGRPAYSDLYYGATVKRPALSVVVPVLRGGQVTAALSSSFSPALLLRLLDTDRPPDALQVWMADRQGRLIAATGIRLEDLGRPLPAVVLKRLQDGHDGVTALAPDEATLGTGHGHRVAASAVSPLTGWRLVVESKTDDAYAAARRVLGVWLLATLAVVAVAAWVTARLANQLSRPLLALARSATQSLQTRRVQRHAQQQPVQVREIALLQRALVRADDGELQRQDEALQLVLARERERLARLAAEETREREAQLRLALQATRLGVWRVDLQRREFTSDFMHRGLWELPSAPQHLPTALLTTRIHPDDLGRFRDAQRQSLQDKHLLVEIRVRTAGGLRWLRCEGDVLCDAEGRPQAVVGVDLDITEQRLLRETLQERSQALEDADRQKNHFLAMLGHELRNPLAPIRASADLLRQLAGEREDMARAAERVQRQTRHLSRLIDDLLDIARITQGKLELRLEVLDLADVLREAVETVRALIDSRRHRLVLQGPPAPVHVRGDATRLLQVVANLLGNAAKYTEEGGKIRLTLARHEAQAVITVEDNGPGLPAEALPTLFDPFTQVRSTLHRAQGGLGIGLAVVRRLVELHGGRVEALSDGPGQGTMLRVVLPRAEPVSTVAPRRAVDGTVQGPRCRVLLVDDNQDAADSLAELLALEGHEVRVAYSASAALDLLDAAAPEVAVLDIGLPDLDGCELGRRLRQRLPALRLIALSGKASADDDQRLAEAGFEQRLVKPADPAVLLALLEARKKPVT